MDGRRFAEIALAMARVANRRHLLRIFGASIFSGIAHGIRVGPAAAQSPTVCVQDSDCIAGAADSCTGAHCDNGTCTFFSVFCIPGHVCCGSGECCPAEVSCLSDADCASADNDPCTGVTSENGTCVPFILSCIEGFVCCGGECAVACDHDSSPAPPRQITPVWPKSVSPSGASQDYPVEEP